MLDHIVVVTGNLSQDASWLAERTGVKGKVGGSNPVNGTCNILFPLGDGAYFELLAADDQPARTPEREPPFGLARLTGMAVAAWSAQVPDFDAAVSRAREVGVPLGEVVKMSRRRPDGHELRWRMTYPADTDPERLCPFLIDWGSSEHPSTGMDQATFLAIDEFITLSPAPREVEGWLAALGVPADVRVTESDVCGFRVAVRGPEGAAVLWGSLGQSERSARSSR